MNKKEQKQNEVSSGVFRNSNLDSRISEIVNFVKKNTSFKPGKLLRKSGWWGSSTIGAFHYSGTFNETPCVLKIQGVKPTTSEIYMIDSFEKQNRSKIIRPPKMYASIPWKDNLGFEAIIMEDVGKQVIVNIPTSTAEIDTFFKLYNEYRNNCLVKPWLSPPDNIIPEIIEQRFVKWRRASMEIYPNHPLRQRGDSKLIDKAVAILKKHYEKVEPEFVHGHFSARNLYKKGDKVILLSNLYWSWRPPCYDTIFAYHWFRCDLAGIKDVDVDMVNSQVSLWINKLKSLDVDQKLLNLALLERAAAGLNLDVLSVDTKSPVAQYLMDITRKEVESLIDEIGGGPG